LRSAPTYSHGAADSDRAELEVRGELGPRRGRHQRGGRRAGPGACPPARPQRRTAATWCRQTGERRRRGAGRAELGPRRGRHQRGGRRTRGARRRGRPRRTAATRCRPRRARGPRRARAAPRRSDISAAVAELDQEHAGEVDRGDDRRRRDAGPRRARGPHRARAAPRPSDISAAVAALGPRRGGVSAAVTELELDQEHAGEVDRGGSALGPRQLPSSGCLGPRQLPSSGCVAAE